MIDEIYAIRYKKGIIELDYHDDTSTIVTIKLKAARQIDKARLASLSDNLSDLIDNNI